MLIIHETLHSPRILSRIQSFGHTILIIKPNKGTLSQEVATEVHCIRRSPDSGRVSEEIDIFVLSNQIPFKNVFPILPIIRSKESITEIDSDSVDIAEDHRTVTSALSNIKLQHDSTSNDSTKLPNVPISNKPNLFKQLVTFDSTDPDFDEDDDPDNDLDI